MSVERVTVEQATANYGANLWNDDEDLDLRKYINALVRWWREIILITLVIIGLVACVILGIQLLLAPRYEASASVAIVRTFSDITLDQRFQTKTDSTSTTQSSSAASLRSALIGLASSGSIAQKVIDQLGNKLSPKEKVAAKLAEQVTAELATGSRGSSESDLINITAKANSPEKATAIANAWAQIYVQTVNAIYGQVPDDLLASIQSEQATAQKIYEKSQTDLEAFVANNHIDTLTRQITETQSVIDNLQRGKQDALTHLVDGVVGARTLVMQAYLNTQAESQVVAYQKEQEGRRALIAAYLNAINNTQVDVFQQQADRDTRLLHTYYQTWQQAMRALDDANALKTQVEKGGQGAVRSSALALQLLKLQVFTDIFNQATQQTADGTTQPGQPSGAQSPDNVRLQLQVGDNGSTLNQDEMLADLNALINVLDKRRQDLETQIKTLSTQLLGGNNYTALGKTIPTDSKLAQSVQAQYAKLGEPSWSSTLTSTLSALATTPVSSTVNQALLAGKAIDQLGQQWAAELLQLKGLTNISTSNDASDAVGQTIKQLEQEKLSLKSQLETEKARQLRLTHERDLNWDTSKTLSSKVAELNLARAANSSEVRLAAPAVPPVEPVARINLPLVVAAAAVGGLIVALIVALFAEYLGKEPFLRRRLPVHKEATAGV